MTTTLLRERPAELDVLLWTGLLQKIRFNEYCALKLLSNAVCCARNAKTTDFTAVDRFFMANEGIHSLSLGVLYLHGLQPTGLVGHRSMVMQLACERLYLPAKLTEQIMHANTQRELIHYGSTEPVQETDVTALISLGDVLLHQARDVYPDWFL